MGDTVGSVFTAPNPQPPTPVRAVFFDVGGTLIYPHPSFHALVAQVCQDHGLTVMAEEVERAEPAVWARITEVEDAGHGFTFSRERSVEVWRWVYRTFLEEIGHPEAARTDLPQRIIDAFVRLDTYRLYDDVLPTLKQLSEKGLILGVISNWEDWLEPLMVNLGIRQHFAFTVISALAGVEKPSPEIFRRALEAAGVTPLEAAHVGDNLGDDVEAAERVGIRGILLDRNERFFRRPWAERDDLPAPTRIRSLLDLPAVLRLESPLPLGEAGEPASGGRDG